MPLAALTAMVATSALVAVSHAEEKTVLFADQSRKVEDDQLKKSVEHATILVKLINEVRFKEAGMMLERERGLDVFERASRNKDWRGVTKLVKAKHDKKNKRIDHMYSFDDGFGHEMYFWLFYKYDKDGLKKPVIFAGGC